MPRLGSRRRQGGPVLRLVEAEARLRGLLCQHKEPVGVGPELRQRQREAGKREVRVEAPGEDRLYDVIRARRVL